MTDAEFEIYEQRLIDEQTRINNAEFQKHLKLIPNQNQNVAEKDKVYMPTDISFQEKALCFEQTASDLYKYAFENFSALWSIIRELNLEFFQLGLK